MALATRIVLVCLLFPTVAATFPNPFQIISDALIAVALPSFTCVVPESTKLVTFTCQSTSLPAPICDIGGFSITSIDLDGFVASEGDTLFSASRNDGTGTIKLGVAGSGRIRCSPPGDCICELDDGVGCACSAFLLPSECRFNRVTCFVLDVILRVLRFILPFFL